MSYTISCIIDDHNPWFVLLAALICLTGSYVTTRLFVRTAQDDTRRRAAWLFLTGVAAGGTIWCTHFVAMLGYESGAAPEIRAIPTGLSLFVAVFGAILGLGLAACLKIRFAAPIGGAVLGLAVGATHFVGMEAYELRAEISWKHDYLATSVLLAVALAAASLTTAVTLKSKRKHFISASLLTLTIISLHFTGMTAMVVEPFAPSRPGLDSNELAALAISIGAVGLLIVGMGVTCYVLDESIRCESMLKLQRMALQDTLTALPNRPHFIEHLEAATSKALRREQRVALFALNIDRFKEINDQFGHDAGDTALIDFAAEMSSVLHDGEFFARLSGDEFAIVCAFDSDLDLTEIATRISRAAAARITVRGVEMKLSASIGVAVFPDDCDSTDALVKAADLAMYRAKTDPSADLSYYEAGLDDAARRKRMLTHDLRRAIETDALTLNYQVQKDIRNDRTIGYEALLRWNHPEHGPISPVEFVPLAEETGLIIPMGEWVLRQACRDANDMPPGCRVAVNISAVQFTDGDLAMLIEDALWQSGLSPAQLEIEITESVLMADMDATVKKLHEIQAMGVQVAMDDFGTGYSSLANLQAFAFDKIKLDRAFIWKLEQSPQAQAIIRAVIALGRSLKVPILAEGVETEGQRTFLLEEGCYEVQGFYYGRPAPRETAFDEKGYSKLSA